MSLEAVTLYRNFPILIMTKLQLNSQYDLKISKNVKEKDIIIKIESEKDVFIQTYDDIDKLVERIELTNLEGEFRIIYK